MRVFVSSARASNTRPSSYPGGPTAQQTANKGKPGIVTHGVSGRAGYDAPRVKAQAAPNLVAGDFRLTQATAGSNRNAIRDRR